MRKLAYILPCLAPFVLHAVPCPAQQNNAASQLTLARATYYTPTANGLKSFHCTATTDWKALLSRFGAKDLPADSPIVNYLDTVHLTVDDDLHGSGTLLWTAPTEPPESIQPRIHQLRDGLEKMSSGYFQTWNAYMNGSMVPSPDTATVVSPDGDGVKLHGGTDSISFDELFDKNFLLTQVHIVQPAMDVVAYPTYSNTPQGRLVVSTRSIIRQPPTAPPIEVTIATTYAEVESFHLPSRLTFGIQNIGTFSLDLSQCAVQTSTKP